MTILPSQIFGPKVVIVLTINSFKNTKFPLTYAHWDTGLTGSNNHLLLFEDDLSRLNISGREKDSPNSG